MKLTKIPAVQVTICTIILQDMNDLDIHMDKEHIIAIGTKPYKDLIKSKVITAAYNYLRVIQSTHSKVKDINYSKLEMQPYLYSFDFAPEQSLASRWISVNNLNQT